MIGQTSGSRAIAGHRVDFEVASSYSPPSDFRVARFRYGGFTPRSAHKLPSSPVGKDQVTIFYQRADMSVVGLAVSLSGEEPSALIT